MSEVRQIALGKGLTVESGRICNEGGYPLDPDSEYRTVKICGLDMEGRPFSLELSGGQVTIILQVLYEVPA